MTTLKPPTVLVLVLLALGMAACTDLSRVGRDAQAQFEATLAADKDALHIDLTVPDTLDAIRGNLSFPSAGPGGSTITWESGNLDVIAADGRVTRPLVGDDATVTLTATFTLGEVRVVKSLLVKVKFYTDAEIASDVADGLTESDLDLSGNARLDAVTVDFALPLTGDHGSSISWEAWPSEAATVDNGIAKLTKPEGGAGGMVVKLKATVTKNSAVKDKYLYVTVLDKNGGSISDKGAITATADFLSAGSLDLAATDTPEAVTSPFTLPLTGAAGASISWTASPAGCLAISSDGSVTLTRAASDVEVTLTASIRKGQESGEKSVVLHVLAQASAVTLAELAAAESDASEKTRLNYTETSWKVLESALALPATGNQEKMDKTDAIEAALKALVPADIAGYLSDIESKARALVESDYSAGTWEALKAALGMKESNYQEKLAKVGAIETALDFMVSAEDFLIPPSSTGIEVSIGYDSGTMYLSGGSKVVTGATLTVTVTGAPEFSTFTWHLDGQAIAGTKATIAVGTSGLETWRYYSLMVVVKDKSGQESSSTLRFELVNP